MKGECVKRWTIMEDHGILKGMVGGFILRAEKKLEVHLGCVEGRHQAWGGMEGK